MAGHVKSHADRTDRGLTAIAVAGVGALSALGVGTRFSTAFCVHSKKRRVRYRGPDDSYEPFVQQDEVESLIVLSEDEARLTGVEGIRHLLGLVAAHQYERHLREGQATSESAPDASAENATDS